MTRLMVEELEIGPTEMQLATLNILEDFELEHLRVGEMQRATFNILDDFELEKRRNSDTQRATFNILDDLQEEKGKVDLAERELVRRAEDLARSNADLERFAHVVSHDLQEPLRTVTGYVQLLQQETEGKLDAESTRFLRNALEGAARMRSMIVDMLTFASAGRAEMRLEPLAMGSIFLAATSNLQQLISDKGATVTSDALPMVRGDRSLLVQLLQNLIGNGIKFHGARPPAVHVSVSARPEAEGWAFAVRDNGIGIDAKDQHRLFVSFQRLHTAAQYPGSGIGLANCRRILERHGGRIWLESEPGAGTTVRFILPGSP